MAEGAPKPKRRYFERHLRAETVVVNGTTIVFYRDPKKRRWNWRAFDAQVTLTDPSTATTSKCTNGPEQ